MKKILAILIVLPFFLTGSHVLAQETDEQVEASQTIQEETSDIVFTMPSPGITPDSPLYALDTLVEDISLSLTRSPEKKAKKAFEIAEEKLAETQTSVNKGQQKAAEKATKRYDSLLDYTNDNLDKAKALGKDVEALAAHVAEQTLKHIAVKQRVYDKLIAKGNLNAAAAVMKSMEKSLNGHERAVQAISKNKSNKEKLMNKGQSIKNLMRGMDDEEEDMENEVEEEEE